jgi:hypothetical protein
LVPKDHLEVQAILVRRADPDPTAISVRTIRRQGSATGSAHNSKFKRHWRFSLTINGVNGMN